MHRLQYPLQDIDRYAYRAFWQDSLVLLLNFDANQASQTRAGREIEPAGRLDTRAAGEGQRGGRERSHGNGIVRANLITGLLIAAAALSAVCVVPARAQDAQPLAREAKNPFTNLINLQFIYDANLGTGPDHKTQHVLNIKPVVPFAVSADWSLITRTDFPLIAQPGTSPGEHWTSGPGDTLITAFLSPARAEHLVWGVGPAFQIPSATHDALGQGKWGAGPAAGALWLGEQWTVGALINNVWSFAGDHSRPAVNQMQLEPQVTYNFRDNPDRYLTYAPTITANWKESGGERWTVPLTLGIGQLVKFGKQSVNLQASAYYNVVKPSDAANWTLELTIQFLFPR